MFRCHNISEIEGSIRKIVEVLKDKVERISIFGSVARGEHSVFSDLDVLIILIIMKTEKSYIEGLKELLCLSVDCDIICYTPEEFESGTGLFRYFLCSYLLS